MSTNLTKWDDAANELTAYCDDDSADTEIGPAKWDDANNKLEINCDSADWQVKWNDADNRLEARNVGAGCCEETNNKCPTCYASNETPRYCTLTIAGVIDCGDDECLGVDGVYILDNAAQGVSCRWYWSDAIGYAQLTIGIGFIDVRRTQNGTGCIANVTFSEDCETSGSRNNANDGSECYKAGWGGYDGTISWSIGT